MCHSFNMLMTLLCRVTEVQGYSKVSIASVRHTNVLGLLLM